MREGERKLVACCCGVDGTELDCCDSNGGRDGRLCSVPFAAILSLLPLAIGALPPSGRCEVFLFPSMCLCDREVSPLVAILGWWNSAAELRLCGLVTTVPTDCCCERETLRFFASEGSRAREFSGRLREELFAEAVLGID